MTVVDTNAANLDALVADARARFAAAGDGASLENEKARFLGKSGAITELLKGLGKLDPQVKKTEGARINVAKQGIEALLDERRRALAAAELDTRLSAEAIDVTLPGRGMHVGGIHPVMRSWRRIEEIFRSIGFDVADGPEIETDWMSFTALNNPENHPARSMQDTFYVDMTDAEGRPLNLRPHTSPMQVRYARMHAGQVLAGQADSIKVISPGRTYRIDNDATHSPMFHQVEGLWLGEDVSFADLKGVYTNFLMALLRVGRRCQVRFPPVLFPVHRAFRRDRPAVSPRGRSKGQAGWSFRARARCTRTVVRNFGLDPEKLHRLRFRLAAWSA